MALQMGRALLSKFKNWREVDGGTKSAEAQDYNGVEAYRLIMCLRNVEAEHLYNCKDFLELRFDCLPANQTIAV